MGGLKSTEFFCCTSVVAYISIFSASTKLPIHRLLIRVYSLSAMVVAVDEKTEE